MKRILFFLIFIGVFLGLFLGIRAHMLTNVNNEKIEYSEETKEKTGELNIPIIEVDTFNPILTSNKQVADVLKIIYEPLIDIDKENRLVPAIASEWTEKDDLNWVIKIRNDVYWHDEKNLTSTDIIFTIYTAMNEEYKSPYNSSVSNILEVFEIDKYTINITLKEKDINFPTKLTFPIIPEHYFKDNGLFNEDKNNRPIGTGPYKYDSTISSRITFIKNELWWKGEKFTLNKIQLYKYNSYGEAIKAFKASEIDIITTTIDSWDKKFGTIGINSYKYETTEFETLIPNTSKIILSDSSVRRAILYAINREKIISDVYNNNANVQDVPIPKYSWIYNDKQVTEYNTETSKHLLINAGWTQKNGKWTKTINGKAYALQFNLMVYKDNEEKVLVAESIKDELSNIGISITINKVNWNSYITNLNNGNFDLAVASFDIYSNFDIVQLLNKESKLNYAKYENEEMTIILDKVYTSNVYIENVFKELQNKYKNEIPYVGLYFKTDILLTNKAVKGTINPTALNPYNEIWTWYK